MTDVTHEMLVARCQRIDALFESEEARHAFIQPKGTLDMIPSVTVPSEAFQMAIADHICDSCHKPWLPRDREACGNCGESARIPVPSVQ